MYIRKPTVDSFKRRAAPAKASSGMAVTAPLEASSNALYVLSEKCDSPCEDNQARVSKPNGSNNSVSTNSPDRPSSSTFLRIRP